jgi:4-amino-4-deoxy-L-arabinose transferase-like glycosyltransferase
MSTHRWLLLLPVFAVYALVALVHPAAGHPGDEAAYLHYARNLEHGRYALISAAHPDLFLWHGPGLPLLLTPMVAAHLPTVLIRVLVGPMLLFAAICVFHQMLREYLRPRTALIASYALAAYPPFFTLLRTIYVEPLATLAFTLAVYFLRRAIRGHLRDAIWAGVSLAVLALARVEYGYVLLVMLIAGGAWAALSRSRASRTTFLASAVGLVLCVPWLVYTYSLTSNIFYWGNSGGLSLYWMAAPGGVGDWHETAAVNVYPQLSGSRPLFAEISHLGPVAQIRTPAWSTPQSRTSRTTRSTI